MHDDVKVVFTTLSPLVARIDVSRRTNPFGMQAGVPFFSHHLGYQDAPLYRADQLSHPTLPEWTFTPLPEGRFIPTRQDVDGLDPAYLARFEGSGVSQGFDLPWLLPAGSYLLIQASCRPRKVREMLMGNTYVPATPNVRALRTDNDLNSAYLLGADPRRPPCTDQPLVGFVVLTSNTYHLDSSELFFFNFLEPLPGAELSGEDLMLIVPLEGELIYDYFGGAVRGQEQLAEWWKAAHAFADWCTTPFAGGRE